MDTTCLSDPRRNAVRTTPGRIGLDYVEVGEDERTLHVYFLGKLPPELAKDSPDLPRLLAIEGGDVITDLRILDADPVVDPDPERDDYLVLRLDRAGDRSRYTLRLKGIEGIDPHYESADFLFHVDCANDLDCKPACECPPAALDEPRPNYLAKDYASLRRVIYDRLALVMPDWRERHVPDLGVTLVELLAYVGDYLSYYQDSVGTEAYLGTARQRISVRRHARLVDYYLHEGCSARAWVHVEVDADTPPIPCAQIAFVTGWRRNQTPGESLARPEDIAGLPPSAVEWFEPVTDDAAATVAFRAAHSRMSFYTWGRRSCCLPEGATSATLLDRWLEDGTRALQLQAGDVLVLAEVRGARTGRKEDADPARRWAVRLTSVSQEEDPLYPVEVGSGEIRETRPTPVVRINWHEDDALPFALCLSAIGSAPACEYLEDVSVALGNIVLVDHGRRVPDEPLDPVPASSEEPCCICEGTPGDVVVRAGRFRPLLAGTPLTHCERPVPATLPASRALTQDPRAALPAVTLVDEASGAVWTPVTDLLSSGPDDRHFVAEIDNDGRAHLRFGDGELGRSPEPGSVLSARYRVGLGPAGNVGAEAITCIVISGLTLSGISITVSNPLPAQGGTGPETLEEAKQFAPFAFRTKLMRAITGADYGAIAARHPELQGAHGALVWTGSWYEANVAIDPWRRDADDADLICRIEDTLHDVRRMGHDLRVLRAIHVPIALRLHVCVLPGHERGHVKAALLERFTGVPGGFFESDQQSFGQSVHLSRIVAAAMSVAGVMCATVTELHRYGEPPSHEIENGVLPLRANEIAELANDPNHPERGFIAIDIEGGT